MKHISCPDCGDGLKNQWSIRRKLQQACIRCEWKGEPYTPEEKLIADTKTLYNGVSYELFDRYGYIMYVSHKYGTEDDAIKSINEDLYRGKDDIHAGPYTAILWQKEYVVTGKVFK